MKINMNQQTRVKLTALGEKKLTQKYKEWEQVFEIKVKPDIQPGGYFESTLWGLFEVFGRYCFISQLPLFENNEIEIVDEDDKYRGYVIRDENSGMFVGINSDQYRVAVREFAARFTKQGAREYIKSGWMCKDGQYVIEDAT